MKKETRAVAIIAVAIVVSILTALYFTFKEEGNAEIKPEVIGQVEENITDDDTTESSQVNLGESKDCGDGICAINEGYQNCPLDCKEECGNGIVNEGETWEDCRIDLESKCGDEICQDWEHYRFCGDCEPCIYDPNNEGNYENECD